MKAVIQTGGKQYVVAVGDVIYVEKLLGSDNDTLIFDKVVSVGEAGNVKFGTPFVEGATVSGTLVKTGKAKKITVRTYRSKKDSKRTVGHRQPYTKVEITQIKG